MPSPTKPPPSPAPAATADEVDAFMEAEMKKAADDNDDADMAAVADGSCAVVSRRRWEPIPEVAALDAKLAPYMKNPEEEALKHQYIAVRLGYAAPVMDAPGPVTAVRNAIFLSWEDAKEFVEFENHKLASVEAGGVGGKRDVMTVPFYSNVEWKAFDEFDKAELFLRKVMPPSTSMAPNQTQEKKKSMLKKSAKKKKTQLKHKLLIAKANAPPRNRGPPTKKWMSMYDLAKMYKSTHDNLDVSPTDTENSALVKWIKYQRDQYRMYLEDAVGGPHSMTDEKVKLLSELGFAWIETDKTNCETGAIIKPGKRGRPKKVREVVKKKDDSPAIRQKWMEMYEKLKTYTEQHGTTEFPTDTEDDELVTLRNWCAAQKKHHTSMTPEKIDLLKSIGFNFPPDWNAMYIKLVTHRKDHGHLRVAHEDDPTLAKWVSSQNEILGRHMQGKTTRLSDEQVMQLIDIGMKGGRHSNEVEKSDSVRNSKWNNMYLKLREYKAEHGHCNPSTSLGTDLSNWVAAQRRMYNDLIQGKPGKRAVLDASKMQRLTEIGFQFRPRGDYQKWEVQMKKLRQFKDENGHCLVPVSHTDLGSFVKLVRREYKMMQQGKKSSMTLDRERELRELGFVFEGGKTPQRSEGVNKSWEERFEELLAFKENNGHTVVPQNSGRLGMWVHSQRVNYKKMKEGKPTPMTAEKALKLTEIGFCFNAADRFRGNKPEEKPQETVNMFYAQLEPPQLPTPGPGEFWR